MSAPTLPPEIEAALEALMDAVHECSSAVHADTLLLEHYANLREDRERAEAHLRALLVPLARDAARLEWLVSEGYVDALRRYADGRVVFEEYRDDGLHEHEGDSPRAAIDAARGGA